MAKEAKEIIGIEIVESAVECARFNAENNGIDNAAFYAGDAKNTERMLDHAESERGEKINADAVILDPPRAGCDAALVRYVATLSPKRIVYISCNPQTLARDMVIFKDLGYVGETVTPVDMFPGTGHVESVVCLTRR
jgi:23S rRNA (uracil1939-C5)-methyltransferase